MMKKALLFLITLVFLASVPASAQKAKLNRANALFKKLDYLEASKVYVDILKKKDISEAKANLAECYRKMNNTTEAEYWFGQVVLLPDAQPIHKLYYAMALQANGKCDLAKPWFDQYTALVPDDGRGRELARACERSVQTDFQQSGTLYQIKMLENVNTPYDDFGPAFYKNGIVFSSERDKGAAVKRTFAWTGRPFLELFFSKLIVADEANYDYKYGDPEKFMSEINTRYHDGPVSFSADFKEMYVTRNNVFQGKVGKNADGIIGLKIFSTTVSGEANAGKVVGLPFNSDEYNICHPALSNDGTKLFFSADIPGGFGGMDLYVSYMENGRWGPPANLGPVINTEGNDVFPYVGVDDMVYFSSDGHAGLGGLDVFSSKMTNGVWTRPMNMGFPINSNRDDFGFIINSEKTFGYLASDRDGGVGRDDIYSFTKFAVNTEVLVFDKRSGEPIPSATVTTSAYPNRTFTTGANGKVTVEVPLDKSSDFTASKETYVDNTVRSTSKGFTTGSTVICQIPLDRPLEFTLNLTVLDKKTRKPIPNATVTLENDCNQPVAVLRTDANGVVNSKLAEECSYNIKVNADKYLTNALPLSTRGKIKSENISQTIELTPFEDETNLPFAFRIEHIYYDFDKSNIREDASIGLYEILKIMQDNPGIIAEIGSHTDARGTKSYNERLSQRRAQSVVKWLTQHGVAKERLVAQGYGEGLLVNDCSDGVKCSEADHQRNRRTEFRVVGSIYGKDYNKGFRSEAPSEIKVDPCTHCDF